MKKTQQGMALIEALVASAVLGIGLVGATQLMLKTIASAGLNRHHTVAQHLAQEAMDCLRANQALCPAQDIIERQGQRYTRQARRTPRGQGLVVDLQVSVQWSASANSPGPNGSAMEQRIEWHSSASVVPAWAGASTP
jgi:prepilin-type N-terminal cleavage/methylation domain-containing protein